VKELAYGPLQLMPGDLGELDYAQLLELLKGYEWRQKQHLRENALMASWVTAPHLKKPLDPKKLLGEKKEKEKTTPEKTRKVLYNLEEEFKKRR
jgi:hypothetical protein